MACLGVYVYVSREMLQKLGLDGCKVYTSQYEYDE